jgi:hypothetical protein
METNPTSVEVWTPTLNLRWAHVIYRDQLGIPVVTAFPNLPKLQQQFVSNLGNLKWEEVPTTYDYRQALPFWSTSNGVP